MSQRKIIILDDEEMMLRSLERRFRSEASEYDVNVFTSVKSALAELEAGECYAFITDVKMPVLTGDQVVGYISQKYPEQKCLVITGQADVAEIKRISQVGNVGAILRKPLEFDRLLEALAALSEPTEDKPAD